MTREETIDELRKALAELLEAHRWASPAWDECLGAWVIRTSPGFYFRNNSTNTTGVLWASRFQTRFHAEQMALRVKDGAGNVGQVVARRRALEEEIEAVEEVLRFVQRESA